MEILVFYSEIGNECNSYYKVSSIEDRDKAVHHYLTQIGSFAWDEETTKLQDKVKLGEYCGLYAIFCDMIGLGYNCFRLDDTYNLSIEKVLELN